jgi:hypothetical protein
MNMEPEAVVVMVALVLSSRGDAPLAKVEPLGRVTFMVVPELFVSVNVSPELSETEVPDKVREYGLLPVHVSVIVEGDAAAPAGLATATAQPAKSAAVLTFPTTRNFMPTLTPQFGLVDGVTQLPRPNGTGV